MLSQQIIKIHVAILIFAALTSRNHNVLAADDEKDTYANKKPNILLILADDVGTGDIPAYWNSSVVDMPNMKKLAEMGVTFNDVHSTPICAPSRYMLLSGNYAHRGFRPNGSWGFYENRNQFLDHQKSIAEVLKEDGYHTSMFGKWHLGVKAPPNGIVGGAETKATKRILKNKDIDWSLPLIQGPGDIGFHKSYMTTGGIQAPPYSFFRDDLLTTNITTDTKYWEKGSHEMPRGTSKIGKHPGLGDVNWDSSAYNMILVNETESFIDNHIEEKSNQPFFAYVALGAVHFPHSPPDQYLDGSPVKDQYASRHLDMLLELDKVVGSLVGMIEDRKLQNDTIIIFTSDNGGLRTKSAEVGHLMSGPLRGEKASIYEGGHRVPLIMRYDNKFPSNERRKKMVGLHDLYATICKLVGIDVPNGSAQDSMSFADYIEDGRNKIGRRKKLATWEIKENRLLREAVRFGSWKLIHNAVDSSVELYNLATDISESVDLSTNPEYENKIIAMKSYLKAEGPCPDDREGKFPIQGLKAKKGCGWFRKKTDARCDRHREGEQYCASVCGRNQRFCS